MLHQILSLYTECIEGSDHGTLLIDRMYHEYRKYISDQHKEQNARDHTDCLVHRYIIARCMDTYIVLCSYKGKQVIGIGSEDFVKHILCLILQFLHAILYIRCTVGCVMKSGVIVCQLRKSFSKLINSIAKFLFPAERPVPILLKIHIIHIVG